MFKNRCRLFVHISKTLYQQLFLAIKVTVNRPGRNSCQLTDILDAHALQAILPHSLYCRKNNSRFGVIQSNHSSAITASPAALFIKGLYTNLFFLARASDCISQSLRYLSSQAKERRRPSKAGSGAYRAQISLYQVNSKYKSLYCFAEFSQDRSFPISRCIISSQRPRSSK